MDIVRVAESLEVEELCLLLPRLREELGLSQFALAEHLGLTQTSVSDWERERKVPSRRNERALRKFLRTESAIHAYKKSAAEFADDTALLASKGR